ncbi:hypothetical protein CAPTEDRAFT_204815 [Capitella teleta]|uniref:G-protein coupled receptors family 1 profile domain-containing protein n=1 Tax=Capitella teleta TaxID=283909 RepID=R7UD80_CAPTE|nr:hypothetical protein CAPTEDRAFT_204815 [Capitella teleta]|eukprot:ELU01227.1 hypothetical protein CAPTEDRAFT_204815 [Capitella teleta]
MDSTEASAATAHAAPSEDSHKVSAFTVITLLIGLIGVCGNGVVLSVIYRSRKTKKSRLHNAFVVNQTALDLGEGLLWIFLSASAFSLMSLTFERYIKIVFPIRHHNSFTDAKKAVLLAMSWLVPFFWLMFFITVTTKTIDGECLFQALWPNVELASFYGWTYIIMFYFLPLAFFIFSYGHMLWTLKKRNSQVAENQQSGGNVSKAQVNIIKTMVLVSACFAILWAPAQLYYFAYIIGLYNGEYLSSAYYIFNIICFTNSVINPFIYAVKIAEFREMVLVMFGFKKSSTVAVASSRS